MLEGWILAAAGAAIGAVIGSFGATAALRLASGADPVGGRSSCDGCGRSLGWAETVPFAAYALAGGRCRSCGHTIATFHLAGEGLGVLAGGVALLLAPSLQGVLLAAIGVVLTVQALIDIKTFRLPNIGNLIIAALCAAYAWLDHRFVEGLVAAGLSGAILFAVKAVLERRKGQALLGLGDVKLICALALAAGQWTAAIVAGASLLALTFAVIGRKTKGEKLPFGPAIAASGFVGLVVMTGLGI